MSGVVRHRDRIYIRKDVILKLIQYGELNLTSLLTFCGLNYKKHRGIIEELEVKDLIQRGESYMGKKKIIYYTVTERGIDFCRKVLEPYESIFPRDGRKLKK